MRTIASFKYRLALTCFVQVFIATVHAQIEVLTTNTNRHLREIINEDDEVYILGIKEVILRCSGDCNQLSTIYTPEAPEYKNFCLNVLDSTNWYILSEHQTLWAGTKVYKTGNGGANWDEILDTSNMTLKSLIVFDSANIFLSGSFSASLYSTDGGETWLEGTHGLVTVSESHKLNDSSAVIGVNSGFIRSDDKGISWIGDGSFNDATPRDYYNLGPDSIFAVSWYGGPSMFSYSFEGGLNDSWVDKSLPFLPNGVYVKSPSEIYVVGNVYSTDIGVIYFTEDLGESWWVFNTPFTEGLNDIEFINDSTALISGTNGLLFKWNSNAEMTYMGISENKQNNLQALIYPNPANDLINIQFNSEILNDGSISIYNELGVLVHSQQIVSGLKNIDISTEMFPPGYYFIRVNTSDGVLTDRFVRL